MLANNTLHKGMYNIMQEWYNYINDSIHIQADLIGMYIFTASMFMKWLISFVVVVSL